MVLGNDGMTAIAWRRTAWVLGCCAAALAAWAWFATRIAPGLFATAYAGEGSSPLDRALRLFGGPRPLKDVLGLWEVATPAVAAALIVHAALVLAIGRWGRRDGAASPRDARLDRATSAVLIVVSLAFLPATVLCGAVQDYYLYQQIWGEVLRGHDPWYLVVGSPMGSYSLNAYGPLYNLLALPTLWNPLGPKLIFAAAYWFFVAWLILGLGRRRGLPAWAGLGLALWFASPFAWVEIAYFGHFDVLVGLLCIAAAEARVQDRWASSAVWLTSGVLLKFFPGVLAPFLALDRGRIRWGYLAAAAGLPLAGMATACAIWGASVFRPITLAVNRESAALSIFRVLRGSYTPIGRDALFFTPDEYATPLLLLALFGAWRWTRRTGFGTLASCVLAVATTLLLYKVGFPQYYMVLFLLAPYWFVRDYATLTHRGWLAAAYAAGFALVAWFDVRIARESVHIMVDWVGLPMFVLMLAFIAAIAAAGPREGGGES
ncbi:hypothetical protein [Paludisphaera mucosa]|uniref:DUF2029 domain-containing protein n=1 Tax=Paludisphaera mucosa TaxID=3030827 RepID=A0ABT6F9A6_9BACT|nr:hypothetical protein [Paludisphaera mucosa]MDG3004170.1 hypothetical protein [Paludisphaera mucosa]